MKNKEFSLVNFLEVDHSLQIETRNWRNSEQVAPFFQLSYIPLDMHLSWLESLTVERPESVAFIINLEGRPSGVTYFHSIDYEAKQCDWGIYIHSSDALGIGLGEWSLSESCEYARHHLGVDRIYLEVLTSNSKAESLYRRSGFKQVSELSKGGQSILRMVKDL